jgi:hypothetical protein
VEDGSITQRRLFKPILSEESTAEEARHVASFGWRGSLVDAFESICLYERPTGSAAFFFDRWSSGTGLSDSADGSVHQRRG